MKVINDNLSLRDFDFWSGAKEHCFSDSELSQIESVLEELYPDGMTDTQINDLFWFEEESICEWIGINYEEYLER